METSYCSKFVCPYGDCSKIFYEIKIFELHLQYCRINHACELILVHFNDGTNIDTIGNFENRLQRCCGNEKELEDLIDYMIGSVKEMMEKFCSQDQIGQYMPENNDDDCNDDDDGDDQVVPFLDDGQEPWNT